MNLISTILPFVIMVGMMYFLLIRPQKQQQEKVQDMLANLEVDDSVATIGGLHGVIDEINEEAETVVLDCEGIYLTFERRSIARVILKAVDSISTTDDFEVEDTDNEFDDTEE